MPFGFMKNMRRGSVPAWRVAATAGAGWAGGSALTEQAAETARNTIANDEGILIRSPGKPRQRARAAGPPPIFRARRWRKGSVRRDARRDTGRRRDGHAGAHTATSFTFVS